jgi:hypothetical protein
MIKICIGDRLEWKDAQDEFNDIQYWTYKHCKSFVEMKIRDVSDVSILYDYVAEFSFTEERDATLFRLKYA